MGFEEKKRAELRLRRAIERGKSARAARPYPALDEALADAAVTLSRLERYGAMIWNEQREERRLVEAAIERLEPLLPGSAEGTGGEGRVSFR